jgi:monofunctional biosynthetic peptidoglycan transglycosylase
LRKALEAWCTLLIEWFWPKQRILEVYLNIAQFGRGIYGAESAAQQFFHKSARRLTASDAALLAAVLPNPVLLRVDRPSSYVLRRRSAIGVQMRALGGPSYLCAALPCAH